MICMEYCAVRTATKCRLAAKINVIETTYNSQNATTTHHIICSGCGTMTYISYASTRTLYAAKVVYF